MEYYGSDLGSYSVLCIYVSLQKAGAIKCKVSFRSKNLPSFNSSCTGLILFLILLLLSHYFYEVSK